VVAQLKEKRVILRSSHFFVLLLVGSLTSFAPDTKYAPRGATAWESEWTQIPGAKCLDTKDARERSSTACTIEEYEKWLADVRHWRDDRRIRIGYDSSRYDLAALKWTQSSFIQPQMMVHDRFFTTRLAITPRWIDMSTIL
jgi:hypothetical protein